jgi:hypothetical protein
VRKPLLIAGELEWRFCVLRPFGPMFAREPVDVRAQNVRLILWIKIGASFADHIVIVNAFHFSPPGI